MTPADGQAISATLQALGRRFVPYINKGYGRIGTLWEGRFKASLVQEEGYLLACYRYIEMNPVRAQMVTEPADYLWSSFRANALGEPNPLLSPHPLYVALGAKAPERRDAYRNLFATHLDPGMLRKLRSCVQTGTPLGDDRFRTQIEQSLGAKVGYSARGRPKKLAATEQVSDTSQMRGQGSDKNPFSEGY
jgi:putative transposase